MLDSLLVFFPEASENGTSTMSVRSVVLACFCRTESVAVISENFIPDLPALSIAPSAFHDALPFARGFLGLLPSKDGIPSVRSKKQLVELIFVDRR